MSQSELDALRKQIDQVNLGILELVNERLRLVDAVREVKSKRGVRFFAPDRESQMFAQLIRANRGPLSRDQIQSIFREIFSLSLDSMESKARSELRVHRSNQDDRVYDIRGHQLGASPQLIAGPCSVESGEQCRTIAAQLAELGVSFMRGGAFKPRTSPYSFQGLGEEGLKMLREAADLHDLAVVTEILDPRHLEVVEQHTDVFQVGTRSMYNYELLKLLGEASRPVLLKRGFMATLEELILAAEYVAAGGNENIIFCERGVRTFERWTRNTLDLSAIPLLKMETPFPVVVDVSHSTGRKDIMLAMAKAALAAGADAVMVEADVNPTTALSDHAQQMDLAELAAFHHGLFGDPS